MVKGLYIREYGGSKSGYEKEVKDTLKVFANLASTIAAIFFITKKK